MTAIHAVSVHLPSHRVPAERMLRAHGFDDRQVRIHDRWGGFDTVRVEPDGDLAALLAAAARDMPELRERAHDVRYVLHGRSMPVVAPYPDNPLGQACRDLGLEHATALSVSQHACASALLAVELAGTLLAADGDPHALALVLAGEKAFTASAQVIIDAGVMSEGAAAVLVGLDGEHDRVLAYATHTDGRFFEGPWMPPDVAALFRDVYPAMLADAMLAAVKAAGLDLDDIALILPHNVNRMSWLRVLRQLGLRGTERLFLENLPELGHCFGADSFISYRSAVRNGRLRPGDHYLMTSVGLGATFSAMVLTH